MSSQSSTSNSSEIGAPTPALSTGTLSSSDTTSPTQSTPFRVPSSFSRMTPEEQSRDEPILELARARGDELPDNFGSLEFWEEVFKRENELLQRGPSVIHKFSSTPQQSRKEKGSSVGDHILVLGVNLLFSACWAHLRWCNGG